MSIIFESADALKMSNNELCDVCKRLNKRIFILMNILTVFIVLVLLMSILSLFSKWNWLFVVCIVGVIDVFYTYRNIPIKFKQRLLKMPDYVFEDASFYAGKKEFKYSEIDMLEIGTEFIRINVKKYKFIMIFKDRDKSEMDMLIRKLKDNTKRYKEV